MKKVFAFILFALVFAASGQPPQLVKWKFDYKKTGPSEYELRFHASPEKGWHLYSQIENPDYIRKKDGGELHIHITDIGDDKVGYRELNNYKAKKIYLKQSQIDTIGYAEFSKPTYFEFGPSKDYERIGRTIEPKPNEYKEPLFNDEIVRSYSGDVLFTQKIKALVDKPFKVTGTIDGITCNDNQCSVFSPPVEFTFDIRHEGPAAVATTAGDSVAAIDSTAQVEQTNEPDTATLPQIRSARVAVQEADDSTLLGVFITGFIGGLFALLTPCVFPMIPMTVSFFIKQSKSKSAGIRNASIYAVSIIAIYIILGLSVTLIFGADAMNNLATNVWFNLFFFLLLIVFAFSFLGAFEITLPSSFVNKMDRQSERGGYLGIFFMAFTLGLVSFSCTGPIIGTLLVQAAATRALLAPFLGMFGFSLALALPFGLFAAFPGWLNSLPKSGGWLNSVKVVLGFLELALALKFLSNADLVVQAGFITREVFIVIWIVIFALLGMYLMGWFKLSHDSDLKHVSVGRLMFAILVFSFTVYLIPGMWGAPLKLISGFPPPRFYSESPEGFDAGGNTTTEKTASLPEHAHRGPHGIPTFDDYFFALEHARKNNKPILLDFTGWACVNCRKMEDGVWSDPAVKKRLAEDFVLVSLYVDDKKQLPEELREQVDWNGSKRTLKTVGNRWSYLQNTKYASSTQPQYWIIDSEENIYADPTSYDPDIQKYLKWMDDGLAKFREK